MNGKIDFVITWVDGSDENWLKEKKKYELDENDRNDDFYKIWCNSSARFRDWENLNYWFRAVEKYTPWVRKIHFVTWGHIPEWLNTDNPKLNIVKHEDYIPAKYLPTFNSHTLEWNLHRIRGLSERFVYFNDDMFVIRPTKENFFFYKGMPCETIGLDIVGIELNIGHAEINNTKVLNKYFNKKDVISKHWKKWINPVNGKYLLKTLLLLPWKHFSGLYESHLPVSYLKSSFKKMWELEPDILDKTCSCRFRQESNLNHWLVKNYQILTGKVVPRSPGLSRAFTGQTVDREIIDSVVSQKYNMVCINDVEDTYYTDEMFQKDKKRLKAAFHKILPKKSSFEK